MKKFEKLEAIRGLTAIYVVIGHLFQGKLVFGDINISFLISFGQEAVILFFLLSGFVIWYSLKKSHDQSFKTYFLKRFLRIYIPLIIVFIVNYVLYSYQNNEWLTIDLFELAGNFFMLQDAQTLKPNVICGTFLNNSPLWSLSYEWWFYMIFYFLFKQFKDKSIVIGYWVGLVAVIIYLIYPFFINRIFMYMLIWFVGAKLADLYIESEKVGFKKMAYSLLILLACNVFLIINVIINKERIFEQLHIKGFGVSPFLELRHFAFAFVVVILAIFWEQKKWIGFNSVIGHFKFIAPISYVLYISHWFMIVKATYLNEYIDNKYLSIMIYVIICLGFSYVIERVIYPIVNRKVAGLFSDSIKKST